MSRPPIPEQSRFLLRLTDDLREQLAVSAKAAGRSMNSEIIARLERSLALDDGLTEIRDELRMNDRRLDHLETNMLRVMERVGLYDPNED